MDGLEGKISKLSPGQRKEVEDFVDFLLAHQGTTIPREEAGFLAPPPDSSKPIILAEEIPVHTKSDLLPGYHDLELDLEGGEQERKGTGTQDRPRPAQKDEKVSRLLDWID
jgi:hypothetical protein